MTTVAITGKPVPFARPGVGKGGKRYTPRRYNDWKTMAVQFMRIVNTVPHLTEPVSAVVGVYSDRLMVTISPIGSVGALNLIEGGAMFSRPKGVRGDLDNYVKAVLDAAQDAQWIEDDRQVVAITAFFGNTEEIEDGA